VVDGQELDPARLVGDVGIGADAEARDDVVSTSRRHGDGARPGECARRLRVADVEVAVRLVVGIEGEPDEPLLDGRADLAGQIEERRRQEDAVTHDADRARLLDDEHATRIERRRSRVERLRQAGGDERLVERGRRRRRHAVAERRDVLELTGGGAAVVTGRVAVVALLGGRVRHTVPAHRAAGRRRGGAGAEPPALVVEEGREARAVGVSSRR
jgi:hypothetical protein